MIAMTPANKLDDILNPTIFYPVCFCSVWTQCMLTMGSIWTVQLLRCPYFPASFYHSNIARHIGWVLLPINQSIFPQQLPCIAATDTLHKLSSNSAQNWYAVNKNHLAD